jgi:hypothetical protein
MKTPAGGEWFDDCFAGFTAYYLTSLPVFLALLLGVDFDSRNAAPSAASADLVSTCFRSDALHYLEIARDGYSYDPEKRSMVAFFPAYPLLSRAVSVATGLSPEEALLLTAHVALLAAFVLLARYVRLRWPQATAQQRGLVLVVFGLWPTGLFFRMPYAESLFVCVTLAVLYGMARGWPLTVLALLAGLGTAVRPVGVALTVAFIWHVATQADTSFAVRVRRLLLLTPLACWGLLAYMLYQKIAFDAPLAFAQTQEHWTMRAPMDRSLLTKLESLAALEPIWGVYLPSSQRYWDQTHSPGSPLFSLIFWNPILFVLAVALLAWGGRKRWLTGNELVLGAALLAIPYLTRGFEMSMASHGRFAAVVVVNYLVLGRMSNRSTRLDIAGYCSALALFLFVFAFLYAKKFLIF